MEVFFFFFTRTGDSATLSRQSLKARLATLAGKRLRRCQKRTAVCLIAGERAGTVRVKLPAGTGGAFWSRSVLTDSAGWVTWLRHPRNGSHTRLAARRSDICSQSVSGNECVLKMQMAPAEGKQVRELDCGHFFFSPPFSLPCYLLPHPCRAYWQEQIKLFMAWTELAPIIQGMELLNGWKEKTLSTAHLPTCHSEPFPGFHVAVAHLCL